MPENPKSLEDCLARLWNEAYAAGRGSPHKMGTTEQIWQEALRITEESIKSLLRSKMQKKKEVPHAKCSTRDEWCDTCQEALTEEEWSKTWDWKYNKAIDDFNRMIDEL